MAAEQPVDAFSAMYNSLFKGLTTVANEAAWLASTDVSDAHEAGRTGGEYGAGGVRRRSRDHRSGARASCRIDGNLPPVVARQLDKILLAAAEGPGTIPDVTRARVAAESHQSSVMDGYTFHIDGKPVSANDIDDVAAAVARSGRRGQRRGRRRRRSASRSSRASCSCRSCATRWRAR